LALALAAAFALSLFVGRYPVTILMSPSRLAHDDMARRLVLNLRLPRLIVAVMLGIALASAGMVFQMLFGNPLVEPGFLGVSQGSAFGACLGIVFLGGQAIAVQLLSALFGFLALGGCYLVARRARFGGWVLRLVLSGIAMSAIFSAGVGVLKFVADPLRQLPEMTFWLLGGLSSVTWTQVRVIAPTVIVAIAVMNAMRWRLNLLSMDDATAFSLGAAPALERGILVVAAVAATAAVVSVAGIISWVGLIVPHIARRVFGADSRRALPGAALMGGILAVLCDDVARTAMAGEISLGILTSLVGAAFFIAILMSRNVRTER
jgi:iron complex transport system permease protein